PLYAARRFRECDAPGCNDAVKPRSLSRFCRRHALALERYGSPVGRPIRPPELKPHRRRVTAFLKANASTPATTHPALLKVFADLAEVLRQGAATVNGRGPETTRLRPRDWSTRRSHELA